MGGLRNAGADIRNHAYCRGHCCDQGMAERKEKVMYTLYRVEPDKTETIVAYIDDQLEIGCAIDEDRKKIDYEAQYKVASDIKGAKS